MYHTSPDTREEVSSSPLRLHGFGYCRPDRVSLAEKSECTGPHSPSVLACPPTPGAAASTLVTTSTWCFSRWRGEEPAPGGAHLTPLGDLSLPSPVRDGWRKRWGKALLRFGCVILNDDGQQAAERALDRRTHTRTRQVEVWA